MPTPLLILIFLILFILSIRFLQRIYYNVFTGIYHLVILILSPINKKAKAAVQGRKNLFSNLEHHFNYPDAKRIWIHCASLGEFEQGRPVIEKIRASYPNHKILLTFYSPSGYSVRKDYIHADYVTYLPFDTKRNARKFIRIAKPNIAIFIKYEFWLHHIDEIYRNKIPLFLVSGVFRKKQLFFKWYGTSFRKSLKKFTTLFVQDQNSIDLLGQYKIKNAQIAFDTRFDRVTEVASHEKEVTYLAEFTSGHNVIVAGSTWPRDESLLAKAFYHALVYENFKLVLAPHQVEKRNLKRTRKRFKKFSLVYSELDKASNEDLKGKRVLIIDNMGMLSSLYKYADVCYIGGGFNKGIHNTLEAAVYGKPLVFGPQYKKFLEAVEMVNNGAAFTISSDDDLLQRINFMNQFQFVFTGAGKDAKQYVADHTGGTATILTALTGYLQ